MTETAAALETLVFSRFDALLGDMPAFGLAVSGGGDSTALMHLAARWAGGRRIDVATVDHNLRPDSAVEADGVAKSAKALGLSHDTLLWTQADKSGNLMASARHARMDLLSGWAQRRGLSAICLGHTRDDLAETFLMRMMRGAGADGLAAMSEKRSVNGVDWLRPLLGIKRQALRDWLVSNAVEWIDDPSNEDTEFDRIRVRKFLGEAGLSTDAIAQSAENLASVKAALNHYAVQTAKGAVARLGALSLPAGPFHAAPEEIRRRLLVAGCMWITGAPYPPRRAAVLQALQAVAAQRRTSLDGALIASDKLALRFIREPAAALRTDASYGEIWDYRWRITGLQPRTHVAALGKISLDDVDWRSAGLTRDEAAASPAIWKGEQLLAAPLVDAHATIRTEPLRHIEDFHRLLVAH